ncbi:MAG: bifunctional (p)ppGpp synthetase/guanosine-3',5'-bis(diphosphate) 3'-pyrophosphohydrolase [Clostridia bacterium]|nr:bifunctional (p)ppGpp synthetase/guanosine-3',5'-bis(diphosphate) 3'-pyrophosphohydrolase [Clostridia bacterium]
MGKLIDDALRFAIEKHSGQMRKAGKNPYILHPMEVGAILGSLTEDEATIAAGILHDTVEDTDAAPEDILEKFGRRVAVLVASETEDKHSDRPAADTWIERKRDTLMILENTRDINVKMMWLADKLSNLRSLYNIYLKEGDNIWRYFNQKDPKMHEWYYKEVARFTSELAHTAAHMELVELIGKLFENE